MRGSLAVFTRFFQIIDIADAREATVRVGACGRSICQFLGVCPAIWYADAALAAFLLFKMFAIRLFVRESLPVVGTGSYVSRPRGFSQLYTKFLGYVRLVNPALNSVETVLLRKLMFLFGIHSASTRIWCGADLTSVTEMRIFHVFVVVQCVEVVLKQQMVLVCCQNRYRSL